MMTAPASLFSSFRNTIFSLSIGGTEACQSRIALLHEGMQQEGHVCRRRILMNLSTL